MNEVSCGNDPAVEFKPKSKSRHDIDALTPGLKAVFDGFNNYVFSLGANVRSRNGSHQCSYFGERKFCAIQAFMNQLTLHLILDRALCEEALSKGSLAEIAAHGSQGELRVVLQSLDDLNIAKAVIARTYAVTASRS